MTLTRKGEYAVRAVLLLARLPEGGTAQARDLAEAAEALAAFMAKILQSFAKRGIVASYRGAAGGFALARPASRITLLEVVEAVEGPILPNRCLSGEGACPRDRECRVHPVWRRVQRDVSSTLASVTVEELAAGGTPEGGREGARRGRKR